MRSSHTGWWILSTVALAGWCCLIGPTVPAQAQVPIPAKAPPAAAESPPGEIDEEIARQQQIVERFVTVLERNPRRGTALDRIYGFHIENGTIEPFVASLRERVEKQPGDGTGWMVLGLIESQRGRDSAAVEAFSKATEFRPSDALAPYYRGQSLVLVGQPEKAAEAFESAIARKPGQVDLLEIFQALGRVHQRAQRPEQALEVWNRLEKLFPNDARVQEQIAATLVEEGQSAEALPRYEALAKTTTDDYRRTVFRIEAAELKVKLNRASEGIADLEQLIGKLNPDSWLFREVRRKIEEVFLRTDDQDGLAKYYERWLEKNKEDVDAMARLARVLARQARVPEAQKWLDNALKLAPSRKELRLAFVEQLVDDQRYPEAIQQYVALDKADPNNPDYLRDWGKLILRDTSRPKEERQAEAERVWRRLLAARPNDPLTATQVADLFRHAELTKPALELYEKAVQLAPASPQYREYLGEYYHILKRPDDALKTWRNIAAGKQRTAANLARLAEVFAQFGYLQEAQPEIAAACALDPKDFSLQLKAADLQIRGEQYDAALASLARGQKLTQNDEEREAILAQQLKTYTLQNKLADLAAQLEKEAAAEPTAERWFLLARYREALREWPEATRAINEALKLQPGSIPSLAAAARIAEQAGNLAVSADFNRKLAIVDRRSRSDYLERVAQLETQLGRPEQALAAGRDLIAAAPGNVETYQFFADLCQRLGKPDDGIDALRRATRVNPNDPAIILSLASALATQFRTDEAIELYWQAFDKGTALDDKLSVIGKLTELHLQTNHLDQLLERLERGRREDDQRREMTICLAQAYHSAGDYGMARQELERLLSENTRDTQLLLQLSKLAESESDLTSAVKFQEQLARLAPGEETEFRLATLLSQSGNAQEAAAILVRLALKEEDPEKLLRNLDSLLAGGQFETALAVLEPKLRENPTDWELLYREGLSLAVAKPEEAAQRFEAILALGLPDDELSTAAKARATAQRKTGGATAPNRLALARIDYSYEVQAAVGLNTDRYYGGSTPRVWTPQNFAQARMAAVGWLYRMAQDRGQADDFVAARRTRIDKPEASSRELWDWAYLQVMRSETTDLLETAERLARQGEAAGQYLYLSQLVSTRQAPGAQRGGTANPAVDRTPPLAPEDLELALSALDTVERALLGQLQTSGYSYSMSLRQHVMVELCRSGRQEDEQRLYEEVVSRAETTAEIAASLQMTVQRGDVPAALALLERFAAKDLQTNDTKSAPARSARSQFANSVGLLAGSTQAQPSELLGLLDRYLDYHVAWTTLQRSNPLNRNAPRAASPGSNYTYIYVGSSRRRVGAPLSAASHYYDSMATTVLRTVFEQFTQKDLVSDLLKHFEQRSTAAAAGDKIFAVLALAHAQMWNDDQETAFETLAAATQLAPQDVELRLDIAQLYAQSQRLDDALAMLDSVKPLDQRVMQQRETLALDIAVRLGDQERAREAAQRLFGLRLSAEVQVQLAGQMRRLGMTEEADAVIARAQRQAGNRLSALAALMGQYQAEGRNDVAVQVAQQILRRSRTQSISQQVQGYSTADSGYRTSALACLSQAGKLKELIAAVETQLERSPQAMQLYETLSEYYEASGDVQKMLDLQGQIVELKPDDAELRYRYARALQERGKHAEACDQYRLAILKQPRMMGNTYWYVFQAYQQAERQADLLKLLEEIDIRALGQTYVVMNLISDMLNDEESRPAAMGLLKKAWKAYPNQRSELMRNFHDSEVWKTPELFEYGKQALIPTADAVRQNPFYGIGDVISYSGDGQVNTSLTYLFDAGMKNNQLPDVRAAVAKAAAEHPQWLAGPAILGLIDLRLGQKIEPQMAFAGLLTPELGDHYMQNARWIVGQELATRQEFQDTALDLLRLAAIQPTNSSGRQFSYGPGQAYVRLSAAAGKREEARKLLIDAMSPDSHQDVYNDPYYMMSQRMQDLQAIGQVATQLDFPVEGLRAYRQLLTDPSLSDPQIQQYTGRNVEHYRHEAQQGLETLTEKLADDPEGHVALTLLAPHERVQEGAAAVDLLLSLAADDLPLAKLESTLAGLIKPQTLSAGASQQLDALLLSLAEKHPRDATVRIVQTLVALRRGDAAAAEAAVKSLADYVAATPLDELAAGQRPNSRQRNEASQQIGLWLVARECWPQIELREHIQPLTTRAIDAARRQIEPNMVAAILYEKGLLALEAGDRAGAERDWNELIDIALVQPRLARRKAATAAAEDAVPQAARVSGPLPATVSQFALAGALAEFTAEKGFPQVSLRAMREALSGGLPVPDPPQGGIGSSSQAYARVVSFAGSQPNTMDDNVAEEVSTRMIGLSRAWRQQQFPAADVCALFEALVFPPARPGDVLLYEQSSSDNWTNPQSIGRLLVDWAVRADRIEAAKQQVAARRVTPGSTLAGQVLLVQLHMARGPRDEAEWNVARAVLAEISKQLDSPQPAALATATHAAGAAFAVPQLTDEAVPLLVKIGAAQTQRGVNDGESVDENLVRLLSRRFLSRGEAAAVRTQVDQFLASRQSIYAQQQAEYGSWLQRNDLAFAANELCRIGDVKLTLEILGRFADSPASSNGESDINVPIWHLTRQLLALPAAERYALLREWTLPTEKRRTLRTIAAFSGGQQVPAAFLPAAERSRPVPPEFATLCNFTLLVEAAAEAGKLTELAAALEPCAAEKLPGAESLAVLVQMAQRDFGAASERLERIAAALQTINEEQKKLAERPPSPYRRHQHEAKSVEWSDYLAAHVALEIPETAVAGKKLMDQVVAAAERTSNSQIQIHAANDLTRFRAAQAGVNNLRALEGSQLALWHRGQPYTAVEGSPVPRMWLAHEGLLAHTAGSEHDQLFFSVPLKGEFQFSGEAFVGDSSHGSLGFAGLAATIMPWGGAYLSSGDEQVQRSLPALRTQDWNRFELQVAPQSVRFVINGYPVYEEKAPSETSPWLSVSTQSTSKFKLRNLQLRGTPSVPREVRLIAGDRLEGWSASEYGETLPLRISKDEPPNNSYYEDPYGRGSRRQSKVAPDWKITDGELAGAADPLAARDAHSLIQYHRPLQDGDRLRYEFFYEPQQAHVQPALGRVAFMLASDGVRLHWMSPAVESSSEPIAIEVRNALVDADARRGPNVLPLKPGDWNGVELALIGSELSLSLNGAEILRRPLDPKCDCRFGLFRFKSETSAHVRNVVLTGDWPAELPAAAVADLLAPSAAPNDAQRLARHQLIGEEFFTHDAYAVRQRAQSLPPEERYELLAKWVLPSADHPTFRLSADFTPTDAAPTASAAPPAPDAIHTGGQIVSPAAELVRTAAEINRLDDLVKQVHAAGVLPHVASDERSVTALLLLIDLARQDETAAGGRLKQLLTLGKDVPADLPMHQRFPEVVAIQAVKAVPALHADTLALAEQLVAQTTASLVERDESLAEWPAMSRRLLGLVRSWSDPNAGDRNCRSVPAGLTQWQAVNHAIAAGRGSGFPAPSWRFERGQADYLTGNGRDALCFQSPLTGNFELRGKISTSEAGQMQMLYGGTLWELAADGKSLRRQRLGGAETSLPLAGKLDGVGPWADVRLVVHDGALTLFINEQQLHTERLERQFDPWIALRCSESHFLGSVRNVQVLGSPTIPREVQIFAGNDLAGSAEYFSNAGGGEESAWRKTGDEVVSDKIDGTASRCWESVLQYHRPLVEDGEVEYEFFYEPGKVEVHPALDRLVFLLQPEGPQIHWLTDAAYDRTGLAPDNVAPLPGGRPVPLKSRAWNKLKLAVAGDEVVVSVNGQDVARRKLEPSNQRKLGWFHYRDVSGARIRNIIHRGNWPQTLPPVEQQELAEPK